MPDQFDALFAQLHVIEHIAVVARRLSVVQIVISLAILILQILCLHNTRKLKRLIVRQNNLIQAQSAMASELMARVEAAETQSGDSAHTPSQTNNTL